MEQPPMGTVYNWIGFLPIGTAVNSELKNACVNAEYNKAVKHK